MQHCCQSKVCDLCLLCSRVFLQDLESCLESPEAVGACFLERVRKFKTPYENNLRLVFNVFLFLFSQNRSNIKYLSIFRKTISIYMNVTVRTSLGLSPYGGSSLTVHSSRYQKPSPSIKSVAAHWHASRRKSEMCALCFRSAKRSWNTNLLLTHTC